MLIGAGLWGPSSRGDNLLSERGDRVFAGDDAGVGAVLKARPWCGVILREIPRIERPDGRCFGVSFEGSGAGCRVYSVGDRVVRWLDCGVRDCSGTRAGVERALAATGFQVISTRAMIESLRWRDFTSTRNRTCR